MPKKICYLVLYCNGYGHVDHGKTSLLIMSGKQNVITGEAGGITSMLGHIMLRLVMVQK